ncbi:transcription factor EB-like [Panulirus ornatus]|uniref:transcription factor EB-like n=1 Tax=Panulirus ornatus TaxID=150431 RepID=UPI003A8C7C72
MEEEVIQEILRLEEEMGAYSRLGSGSGRLCVSQPNLNVAGLSYDVSHHTTKTSGSCPLDLLQEKSEASAADPCMEAYMTYRRKKETHNLFERRRRSLISNKIRELASLLPKSNEPYFEVVRDRCNTGQILRSSVDYMRRLKLDMEHHRKMETKRHALEVENQQLWARVRKLEALLSSHNIKVEDTDASQGDDSC